MKTKLLFLPLLFIGLLATSQVSAQVVTANSQKVTTTRSSFEYSGHITYRLQTGFNLSKLSLSEDATDEVFGDEDFNRKTKGGFHLGVIADIPFSLPIPVELSIQTGLLYTMRGCKAALDYVDDDDAYEEHFKGKLSSHYFQIPIYPTYHYSFEKISLSAFTGPYIAIGLGGKCKTSGGGYYDKEMSDWYEDNYKLFGSEFKRGEYNEDKSDDVDDVIQGGNLGFRRFDIGWSLGVGVTWQKIYFGLQYDWGLISMGRTGDNQLFDKGENARIKNRNFSLSVGYLF
ncbi:MAG: PorT family protein [Porphyromonadaceae bacterium]|nr:PorT family protein [Porphyromonadaceae bacterium]